MIRFLKTVLPVLISLATVIIPASAMLSNQADEPLRSAEEISETQAAAVAEETQATVADETPVTEAAEIPDAAPEIMPLSSDETAEQNPETESEPAADTAGEYAEQYQVQTAAEEPVIGKKKLTRKEQHLLEVQDDSGEFENGADIPETDDSGELENGADVPLTETVTEKASFVYYAGVYKESDGNYYAIPLSYELQEYTWQKAEEYGVPYEIVMGLMGMETGWRTDIEYAVHSGLRYIGLGQLSEIYCADYFAARGIDIYTPEGNIEAICSTLADKLYEFEGNIHHALMAYNQGSGSASYSIWCGYNTSYYSECIVSLAENFLTQEEFDAIQ